MAMDRYLNPKEKEKYPEWLEKQEERRAELAEQRKNREILSTAPPEPENKEDEPEAQYEYHLGDSVYIGASQYEILSFDENRVMLYDFDMPLFNKELSREEFDRKVRENPMNDHLKVSVLPAEEKTVTGENKAQNDTETVPDFSPKTGYDEPEETTELMNYSEEKTFIPEYQELYLQNNDMVGWIKVEDTKINYPVMQSKDNPNFYLKHGFDKAYTDYGCPYVQENCDMELPSDNIIIYGHHMNDGSMFAGLMKFKDKSFWEKHKTVSFDTLTDRQTYEVIAVFKTVVYTDSPDSFKYYQFVNADTAEDFTAYVEKCKKLSLYETGITAEYGDKLLTLSTCEYSRTNGRLVVVAKLINE